MNNIDSSQPYFNYWGKAKQVNEEQGDTHHLLVFHSLDVAAAGHVLLLRQPALLKRLSQLMGLPPDQTLVWAVFLLGLHDLGKFAETFQTLRPDLRQLLWPDSTPKRTHYSMRHDTLGQILWKDVITSPLFEASESAVKDFADETLDIWLSPVFGHHGWPPFTNAEQPKNHFASHDETAAHEYVADWLALMQPDFESVAELNTESNWRKQQKHTSWLLAGIAVLADWLGSNQEIFTYQQTAMPLDQYWQNIALPNAEKAVAEAGLLPKTPQHNLPLTELFPYITSATPLQKQCEDLPLHQLPQLFILEDVTGAGKTEAALILAHRLMSAGLAHGIYIGLPTMATANAMYDRMTDTYLRLYKPGETPSLILSHSARHLSESFQQSLLNSQHPGANYRQEENISAQCNRWLADNRKKALLADVGIGTIDQALLGIVPARHQSLRLLGLQHKVLILDEVHAYDAYTNELLKRLIEFHAALGGSVILLSATLTHSQRTELTQAFYGSPTKQKRHEGLPVNPTPNNRQYPLLTHASSNKGLKEYPLATRESVKREVKVEFYHQQTAVYDAIKTALAKGKSVCWIRNTVPDAREAWHTLHASGWVNKEKLHLFHSRYALGDRIAIEQEIIQYFGSKSTQSQRQGRILIATQVVEQSLDLDFDLMITDLAPIDLIIQRAGRLQRHNRDQQGERLAHGETDQRGTPRLIIHAPEYTASPQADWFKNSFPKAHYVYPHTLLLWRTVKILSKKGGWHMPGDARELLEFVYDESGDIPTGLDQSSLEAEGENKAKKDNANFLQMNLTSGYSHGPQWDEEARVATRLGEESHTLYLARWENNQLTPWINEDKYPWDLSSVKVNKAQLEKLVCNEDKALQDALTQLRDQTQVFDEFSFIVPLSQNTAHDLSWVSMGESGLGKKTLILYSEKQGLTLKRENPPPF